MEYPHAQSISSHFDALKTCKRVISDKSFSFLHGEMHITYISSHRILHHIGVTWGDLWLGGSGHGMPSGFNGGHHL